MTTYAGLYGPEALIDGTGHPITSATIDVFTHGTTTHVSLYQDNARVTPLSNPVPNGVDGSTAGGGLDTFGNLSFYIDPGRYDLRIATGAGTRTVEIEIETDPAESAASGVALTASAQYGTDPAFADGTPVQPWKPAADQTANLVTGLSLPYSFRSVATAQTVQVVRVDLLAGGRQSLPLAVRVYFTASIPGTEANFGSANLVFSQRTSGGATQTGGDTTIMGVNQAAQNNYKSMVEIVLLGNTRYLDIEFVFQNTYTGTVGMTEADVRLVNDTGLTLFTGCDVTSADTATGVITNGHVPVDRAHQMPDGRLLRSRLQFALDGIQEIAYQTGTVFLNSLYPQPTQPGLAVGNNSGSDLDTNQSVTAPTGLHIGNNDLVMNVLKANASAYELRGNTHGGESGRAGTFSTDYVFEYDRGTGTWDRMHGDGQMMNAYRVRHTLHTKVVHSDNSAVFANIDRVYTSFADGVTRCDRTVTAVTDFTVERFFYVMNSGTVETAAFLGRVGRARNVLKDFNGRRPGNAISVTVNGAHAPGATTLNVTAVSQQISPWFVGSFIQIGSGGTVETRRVTAATASSFTLDTGLTNSHSTGEAVVQVAQATTLASAPAAGATTISCTDTIPRNAFVVIDNGVQQERRRVTSWAGTGPYTIGLDTALAYAHVSGAGVQPIIPGDDQVTDGRTDWACYQEPEYGAVFGHTVDRKAIAAHNLGGTLTSTLVRNSATNYIKKIYTYLLPPAPVVITAGTVLTDTYYYLYYVPKDTLAFHDEIARFAALDPTIRAAMYPAT